MNRKISALPIFLLVFIAAPLASLAQDQPPCSGSVSITDPTQAHPGVLAVVSNSAEAAFTVTGPVTYHGSGYYWVQQGIPPGTYAITWSAVASCSTPSSETKATDSRGSVAFAGNYQTADNATTNPSNPPPAGGPSPTQSTEPTPPLPPTPAQRPAQNSRPAITPQTPTAPPATTSPKITKPEGFFSRFFSSIASFFKIYSAKKTTRLHRTQPWQHCRARGMLNKF